MTPASDTRQVGHGELLSITYRPRAGLLRVAVVNWLLNIVTFTLYRFWAKTRVRRHIWSCVHVNGEPLEYTGTGEELFLGALVVFGVLFLPFIAASGLVYLVWGPQNAVSTGLNLVFSLIVLVLYGMAVYRARRYRLSRTLWRGIRGTMSGSPGRYTLQYFAALVLKLLTLGWSSPAMNLRLENRIVNETMFGSEPFGFAGSSAPLYRRYAVCWFIMFAIIVVAAAAVLLPLIAMQSELSGIMHDLNRRGITPALLLIILVAGIAGLLLLALVYAVVWAGYSARQMNVFAAYTNFGGARFSLAATAPSLIWLYSGNLLIFVFTLGLGQPFIAQRNIRYFIDRLSPEGSVDWSAIRQSTAPLDKRGEGLADAFDIDIF